MKTLLPVVTLIVGYLGSLLTEWFRDRRVAARETAALLIGRKEKRDEFQRQTLLDVQEALQRYMRSLGSLQFSIETHYRTNRNLIGLLINAADNEFAFDSNLRLLILTSRIIDDDLRRALSELRSIGSGMIFSKSTDDAQEVSRRTMELQKSAIERMGQLIRKFDLQD